MDLTVNEAAAALQRSPRMVRYMIRTGQLKAKKKGNVWRVDPASLPRSDAQRANAEKRRGRVRKVVESALAGAISEPTATPRRDKPSKAARGPFSIANFRLIALALELYEAAGKVPALCQDAGPLHPGPRSALLEGMRALSVGYYHFDRQLKRDAYLRARFCFARALSDLLALEGSAALTTMASAARDAESIQICVEGVADPALAAPTVPSAAIPPTESPPSQGAYTILLRLDAELLPGIGRLLHRNEARG